ncbi:MAG: hypothetical protein Q8M84_03180 [Thiobacillus sp.]|nr:hypothetical protein [Thiobacillus sp.]
MKYTLVKPDGTIGQSHDFDAAPPLISPNKGRWLPDNPPAYDPLVTTLQVVTPIAADATEIPYTVAPRPAEQIVFNLTNVVQAYLDATARTRNYDGILSLCSYAASAHLKFGAEGLAGVAWRDAVWASCYSILAEVQTGIRTVPTADELMAELPAMVWPA